ncbi:MAG: Nif3-like dinuclear metal center hexameric protein [Armatimonadota bacterium]|nr:Nif3-like dinuclear metal center hexameric protein [Armatimonadota bacterium]
MKAVDLHNHMRQVGTWVNWEDTVDRFIIGSSDTEIKGIAVAWQSRTSALKKAIESGCNLFVTHEPTFYRHRDNDENVFKQPFAAEKRKLIEDNGLVIYRCHDVWDQMPKIGIVDSWAAHLGLGKKLNSEKFHSVHESPKPTLLELAQHVAAATSYLNQNYVEMVGNPDRKVSKVGIGCGAITNYYTMMGLGADVIIGSDDGMRYWYSGAWSLEQGTPLIIVNHPTAEEPGIRNLADYLETQFRQVKTVFIPQGCMYTTIVT